MNTIQNQAETQTANNEVNVDVTVPSKASSYDRVLRVRMGIKAGPATGSDRCSRMK